MPAAGAVHHLCLRDVRGNRLRDETAVEGVACQIDLALAISAPRLV